MIHATLPGAVVRAVLFPDPADAALSPDEAAVVATVLPRRRKEFTSTWLRARRAPHALGFPAASTVVGGTTHRSGRRDAIELPYEHRELDGSRARLPGVARDQVPRRLWRIRLRGMTFTDREVAGIRPDDRPHDTGRTPVHRFTAGGGSARAGPATTVGGTSGRATA